jgi:hypothetical protein
MVYISDYKTPTKSIALDFVGVFDVCIYHTKSKAIDFVGCWEIFNHLQDSKFLDLGWPKPGLSLTCCSRVVQNAAFTARLQLVYSLIAQNVLLNEFIYLVLEFCSLWLGQKSINRWEELLDGRKACGYPCLEIHLSISVFYHLPGPVPFVAGSSGRTSCDCDAGAICSSSVLGGCGCEASFQKLAVTSVWHFFVLLVFLA